MSSTDFQESLSKDPVALAVHLVTLITPFQQEGLWKGVPTTAEVRRVLVKILSSGRFETV